MPDAIEPTGLKAWKRARPPATAAAGGTDESAEASRDTGRPIMCGGPEYTVQQRFELLRRLQREMDEEAEREREKEKAEARKKARAAQHDDEDEDEAATERFRNDRYAVGLLRKQSSDWGGSSSAGSGILG